MTRINCVPVEELTREHLVAEYRELPRVFALIRRAIERGETPGDIRNPRAYTLGTGHVRFFYNKVGWLANRFNELVWEMKARGYTVRYSDPPIAGLPFTQPWNVHWEPCANALRINRERISERLSKKVLDSS